MKCLFTLSALLLSHFLFAQKIATQFQEAEKQGILIKELDNLYPSALHSDSTKAVFRGKEKEFYDSYVSLLKELGSYLKKQGYTWGKTTRCFNRIYVNKDGSVGYFLFNFKEGVIDAAKEKEFKRLLGDFIKTYQFPLESKSNFAQCSPVVYSDN
jgi:hypothetical protein